MGVTTIAFVVGGGRDDYDVGSSGVDGVGAGRRGG